MSLEEEALCVMSKDNDGNPAVPVSWLWDAIRAGCSRVTAGGKQTSFIKFQSVIHLPPGSIPLQGKNGSVPEWEVYKSVQHRAVRSKRLVLVLAPLFRDWSLRLDIILESSSADEELVRQVLLEAGKAGIGLFHPPKKHFGQFKILGKVR